MMGVMKKILPSFAACLLLATGCVFDEDYYIDFSKIDTSDTSMFQVTSKRETNLSEGLPDETLLPGGTPVNEFIADSIVATKATNTTAADFFQNFIKWEMKGKVIEVSGIYQSIDENGDPVTLSGKVILPAKQPIKRVILVSHYTIGANSEAPSNSFPLEGQLASLGYAIVVPDYLGYGVTGDRYHPYLLMELTARNVVDMYLAVVPFLKAIDREPENDDIYLMGYSQGGATTMAVEYVLERTHGSSSSSPVKIKRVFAGGGIYDVKHTFENYIETNKASYPCGVPFVLVGQVKGNQLEDDLIYRLMRPEITKNLDDWFLKKKYTTGQMNKLIGTNQTDKILSEAAFDRTGEDISTLYQVLTANSVLSLAWTPQAPVYMIHSIDDETVPFDNASRAKAHWTEANIQYNFGNYGSHVTCCLRFIYTVKTILEDED